MKKCSVWKVVEAYHNDHCYYWFKKFNKDRIKRKELQSIKILNNVIANGTKKKKKTFEKNNLPQPSRNHPFGLILENLLYHIERLKKKNHMVIKIWKTSIQYYNHG